MMGQKKVAVEHRRDRDVGESVALGIRGKGDMWENKYTLHRVR